MASTTKNKAEPVEPIEEEAVIEQPSVWVYIGPTFHGEIQENSIYTGTIEDVKELLAGQIEKHPGVVRLIVPADENLAQKRADAHREGTLYHKLYLDVLSGNDK